MRSRLYSAVIVMMIGVGACLGAGTAAAAKAPTTGTAVLRGAHFSPDTPSVDVYLTAFSGHTTTLWLSSVGYGDVSPYRKMTPGLYAVSMRLHGAKASSPAALSWTIRLRTDHAYTAAAIGMNSKLHGIILSDRLRPPPSGDGAVRVVQAASRAAHARITVLDGPVVAKSLPFGSTSAYATITAGHWNLKASAVGTSLTTQADLTVSPGSIGSIVVLDAKGSGLTIRTLGDAVGSAVAPTGAVPAGGGGTAGQSTSTDETTMVIGAVGSSLLVVAGALSCIVVARRRRIAG